MHAKFTMIAYKVGSLSCFNNHLTHHADSMFIHICGNIGTSPCRSNIQSRPKGNEGLAALVGLAHASRAGLSRAAVGFCREALWARTVATDARFLPMGGVILIVPHHYMPDFSPWPLKHTNHYHLGCFFLVGGILPRSSSLHYDNDSRLTVSLPSRYIAICSFIVWLYIVYLRLKISGIFPPPSPIQIAGCGSRGSVRDIPRCCFATWIRCNICWSSGKNNIMGKRGDTLNTLKSVSTTI